MQSFLNKLDKAKKLVYLGAKKKTEIRASFFKSAKNVELIPDRRSAAERRRALRAVATDRRSKSAVVHISRSTKTPAKSTAQGHSRSTVKAS